LVNPVTLEVKLPVPVPLVVFESAVVGAVEVLQHTPLAVTAEPPSEVILPPVEAVVAVISITGEVDTTGSVKEPTYS
jgi:hypothetical protein